VRRLRRLDRASQAREAYRRYPPSSRPLRENEELMVPNQIEPSVRPLAGPDVSGTPRVSVRLTQDRVFVQAGDAVTVGLEAQIDGEPVAVQVASAELVSASGNPPSLSAPLLSVPFTTSDRMTSATFGLPDSKLGDFTGDLILRAQATAGGERGAVTWTFVYTASPPAAFTGEVRDRLESGSVAFTVGVKVSRPGRYRILGRIDDARGKPLALARFDGELAAGGRQVELLLFGKIARDEEAVSPFLLRDLEGFRLLDGVYPDREIMPIWNGPYRSQAYPTAALSPSAWDGGHAAPQQ
jgi:hypothetical protein